MSMLTDLFTNIANIIRVKTGSTAAITASNFPTEIAGITESVNAFYEPFPLDTIKDNNSTFKPYLIRVNNMTINSGTTSLLNCFKNFLLLQEVNLPDVSSITSMDSMFQNCASLTVVSLSNTSNVTSMYGMFKGCTALTTAPLFDTSHATNMSSMFQDCTALTTVPLFDTSNVRSMWLMFDGCTSLTTVPRFDMSSMALQMNTNLDRMFQGCTALSATSLDNILGMCVSVPMSGSSSYNKKLSYLGINTSDYSSVDFTTLSNYQSFIDAGWSLS